MAIFQSVAILPKLTTKSSMISTKAQTKVYETDKLDIRDDFDLAIQNSIFVEISVLKLRLIITTAEKRFR
jgi:hypothetical protein